MRELSEMQVISPIVFWKTRCFICQEKWDLCSWLLFLRLSAEQAMMGELRGYADAASFGHWVKCQIKKPKVNLEV